MPNTYKRVRESCPRCPREYWNLVDKPFIHWTRGQGSTDKRNIWEVLLYAVNIRLKKSVRRGGFYGNKRIRGIPFEKLY